MSEHLDMTRRIVETADGSTTIEVPELGVSYKSVHGAATESRHVFVENGLKVRWRTAERPLDVLEIGFGTGLNALNTLSACEEARVAVRYTGVEFYPVAAEEVSALNYQPREWLLRLHEADWGQLVPVSAYFSLEKLRTGIETFCRPDGFDVVYFDAFAPSAQPHLWQLPVMSNMFSSLRSGGVLVTYCAQGEFRRTLKAAGFVVEKVAGPPGKREMTRAVKI